MTLLLLEKGLVLEGHQNRGYLGSRVEPKIGGGIFPPKWMVKIRKKPIRIDDLGGNTPIFGYTHIYIYIYIYTWYLFVLYFWGLTFHLMGQMYQNMGHLGSRYVHIPYFIYQALDG